MSGEPLGTADDVRDRRWGEAARRAYWSEPEPMVVELVAQLRGRGVKRVADVGAGIGRHSLAYARAGFDVVAIDASTTAVEELEKVAKAGSLQVEARVATFTALPLEDGSVDHVLAWDVVHRCDREMVRAGLAEWRRVLRPGGTLQVTILSKRHKSYGVGPEQGTFVDLAGKGDKEGPHFYAGAAEVTSLLAEGGFEVVSLTDVEQQPGDFHWVAFAESKA